MMVLLFNNITFVFAVLLYKMLRIFYTEHLFKKVCFLLILHKFLCFLLKKLCFFIEEDLKAGSDSLFRLNQDLCLIPIVHPEALGHIV